MNKIEIAKKVSSLLKETLAIYTYKPVTKETADASLKYWILLAEEHSFDALQKAVRKVVLVPNSKFFPTPGEIVTAILEAKPKKGFRRIDTPLDYPPPLTPEEEAAEREQYLAMMERFYAKHPNVKRTPPYWEQTA